MGVRKAGEQHIRLMTKNSTGTYSVSIPITIVRELGLKQGQKLVVRQKGKKIIVEDWRS